MATRRMHRHRITIQSQGTQKSASGAPVPVWTDIAALSDLPAGFEIVRGYERFRGRQVQADVDGVFMIRLQPTEVSPKYRVIHLNDNNRVYNIVSAIPMESDSGGAFREVGIFVKALAP